jgi:hypothetical protein
VRECHRPFILDRVLPTSDYPSAVLWDSALQNAENPVAGIFHVDKSLG